MTPAEPNAVRVLREYANALRGDWGSIDGRSEKMSLNAIADAIVSNEPHTMESLRNAAGVCPAGGGHGTDYCAPGYCPSAEVSS